MLQVGTGARSTVLSSQGGTSLWANVVTVFGSKAAHSLQEFSAAPADGINIEG